MTEITNAIELFDGQQIRTAWDTIREERLFSIIDIISVLTGSSNPKRYWTDLKAKLSKEAGQPYDNFVRLKLPATDGKMRLTDVASLDQMFRIIQSIPSKNAEPIKQWMSSVAAERIAEIDDPQIAIDRAKNYYKKKGYGDKWIRQRMQGISIRNALTDEWKRSGVKDDQYGALTDILTKEWSGFTTGQYKRFKGLKSENLRDNFTNLETVINTLAEAFTTELSKKVNPKTLPENSRVAKRGGSLAKETRDKMEAQLGHSIVTRENAKSLQGPNDDIETLED